MLLPSLPPVALLSFASSARLPLYVCKLLLRGVENADFLGATDQRRVPPRREVRQMQQMKIRGIRLNFCCR